MAGTKTIFNATGLECFVELLAREHGFVLDPLFHTRSVESVTATEVVMRVTGLAQGPSQLPGKYRNSFNYRYKKVALSRIIPPDLSYSGQYPTTARSLFAALTFSHDLLFEDSDLALLTNGRVIPLTGDTPINIQPGADAALHLQVRNSSLRFVGGEQFNLFITTAGETGWTPLTLTGNAPDGDTASAYRYQYQVSGGRAPYQFSISAGQAPAALDPATGEFVGPLLASGNLQWTVQAMDDRGIVVDLPDAAMIEVRPLEIVTATLPDGRSAQAYTGQIEVRGGVPPYAVSVTAGAPLDLRVSSAGQLSGTLDYGTYLLQARVVDQSNASVQRQIPLTVTPRTTKALAQSLLGKVLNWFEFDQQSFTSGSEVEAVFFRGNGANRLLVQGDGALGDADSVRLNGQFLQGEQQYPDDLSIAVFYSSTANLPGAGIVGRATSQIGWSVFVDETVVSKIQFSVAINGRTYAVISDDGYSYNSGQPTLLTAQRVDARLQLHHNAVLTGTVAVPDEPIDTTQLGKFKLGHRDYGLASGYWNADVTRLITSTTRLWSDELAYLYNGGNGRRYLTVVADAQA